MTGSRGMRLRAMLALTCVGAVVFATAASAGQASRDTFHDARSFVLHDYCDVSGLDVRVDSEIDGRFQFVPHGPDGVPYFLQHGTTTETLTNLASGTSVTSVSRVVEKDLRVTDNRDGTFTILVLATGNATVYGPDGKAIARNPGQVRLRLLIDNGGTPSDPSDDETIDATIVKPSTGRSDDFCAATVPALT